MYPKNLFDTEFNIMRKH